MSAMPGDAPQSPLWKRLLWMAAIWTLSVTAMGLIALALRVWIA